MAACAQVTQGFPGVSDREPRASVWAHSFAADRCRIRSGRVAPPPLRLANASRADAYRWIGAGQYAPFEQNDLEDSGSISRPPRRMCIAERRAARRRAVLGR